MKWSWISLLALTCIVLSLGSCKGKRDKRHKGSVNSKSVGNIAEEYKRLDKLCNEIEVKSSSIDLTSESSSTAKSELKDQLLQMKLDVMNLQTELKSNIIQDRKFNEELIKSGLDAALIDILDQRISKLTSIMHQNGQIKENI